MEISAQEQLSCSSGLRALINAVEARVLSDLQAGISALLQQARGPGEKVLEFQE